jgi:fused signal recognition particle receptor
MFKFLKEKLKGVISKFSAEIEEEAEEEAIQREAEEVVKEKPEEKRVKEEKKEDIIVKEEAGEEVKPVPGEAEKKEEQTEEVKPTVAETEKAEPLQDEKKGFFTKLREGFTKKTSEPVKEIKKDEEKEEPEPGEEEHEEEPKKPSAETQEDVKDFLGKKGVFAKIREKVVTKRISEKQFENLFWDLEVVLLENNVAVDVIKKIKDDLKKELVDKPIIRSKIQETILKVLKKSLEELFSYEPFDLLTRVREGKRPYIICFFGVNGSGKTTTIAKIAKMLKDNHLSCVLAAADTFRAAAIDQLEEHAKKLNLKVIKHSYGSDAAAVAFDAIKHAEATNKDVVLIDTAGRLHSNINLMEELKKVVRVACPDLKIFVGESITGNDCVEQASQFNDAIGIDSIILTKADVDEKGGAAISISYVTKKPIMYLGVGQHYNDLRLFDSDIIIQSLGLAA